LFQLRLQKDSSDGNFISEEVKTREVLFGNKEGIQMSSVAVQGRTHNYTEEGLPCSVPHGLMNKGKGQSTCKIVVSEMKLLCGSMFRLICACQSSSYSKAGKTQ
jgi:hypothetical protein